MKKMRRRVIIHLSGKMRKMKLLKYWLRRLRTNYE